MKALGIDIGTTAISAVVMKSALMANVSVRS